MATIQVVIHTDGAAFQEERGPCEVGHLLRGIIEQIHREGLPPTSRELIDINGNTCGAVTVTA